MDNSTPSRAHALHPRAPREALDFQSHNDAVEQLLDHLLVPTAGGYLIPASSQHATIKSSIDSTPSTPPLGDNLYPALLQRATLRANSIMDLSDIPPSDQAMLDRFDRMSDTMSIADTEDISSWLEKNPNPWQQTASIPRTKSDPLAVSSFMNACQERGVQPFFDYDEPGPQRFRVTLRFGEHYVTSEGAYPSKKLAKESACRGGIPLIETVAVASKKRKSISLGVGDRVSVEELNSKNWNGTLTSFLQRNKFPPAIYDFKQTMRPPFLFSATVTFSEGPPDGWGARGEMYGSKTEAKKAAARCGVLWLRSKGFDLPEMPINDEASIKRRRSDSNGTGLTQGFADMDVVNHELTLPNQVQKAVQSMGYCSLQWRWKPSQVEDGQPGSFVDMEAHFHADDVKKNPSLSGPIASVKHINGQKKAKERLCVEVLRKLEEMRRNGSLPKK